MYTPLILPSALMTSFLPVHWASHLGNTHKPSLISSHQKRLELDKFRNHEPFPVSFYYRLRLLKNKVKKKGGTEKKQRKKHRPKKKTLGKKVTKEKKPSPYEFLFESPPLIRFPTCIYSLKSITEITIERNDVMQHRKRSDEQLQLEGRM